MSEWRYLGTKQAYARHALSRVGGKLATIALCGVSPLWYSPDGWFGTGSQAEYERRATLPACRRCLALGATDEEVPA